MYWAFSALAASMLQSQGTSSGYLIDAASGNSTLLVPGMDQVGWREGERGVQTSQGEEGRAYRLRAKEEERVRGRPQQGGPGWEI